MQGGRALFARFSGIAPSPGDMDFAYRTREGTEEAVADLASAIHEGRDSDSFDIAVRYDGIVRAAQVISDRFDGITAFRPENTYRNGGYRCDAAGTFACRAPALAFAPAATHGRE